MVWQSICMTRSVTTSTTQFPGLWLSLWLDIGDEACREVNERRVADGRVVKNPSVAAIGTWAG